MDGSMYYNDYSINSINKGYYIIEEDNPYCFSYKEYMDTLKRYRLNKYDVITRRDSLGGTLVYISIEGFNYYDVNIGCHSSCIGYYDTTTGIIILDSAIEAIIGTDTNNPLYKKILEIHRELLEEYG